MGEHQKIQHSAAWMLLGKTMDFGLQAIYFVLLARLLGVLEYGIFAGAYALVNTVTPYSALGAAMLFLRHLAVNRDEASVYWGNALLTTSGFTLVASLLVAVMGFGFHRIAHPAMILVLLVANCFCLQITTLGSTMLFALGDARAAATMNLLTNLSRLLVVITMKIALTHATALQWSVGVLAGSVGAAAILHYRVLRQTRRATYDLRLLRCRMSEGLGFSFAGTTEAVNNDLDKIMLSYYGMNLQNGFYTLAYRIIDFATSPIGALTTAVMQRHFVLSPQGVRPVLRLALKSLWIGCALGLVIAAGVLAISPLLPLVAGRDFSDATRVLKLLCWLPLIRAGHQMCGSAVTGLGHQNWRTAAQFVVAMLNVGLNWVWIPRFGWHGAVWSTLASDGLLFVLNGTLLVALALQLLQRESAAVAADPVRSA
jgi:O-antigen/teichoic acid export membrane protein